MRKMKIETEKGHEIVSRILLERIKGEELLPGDKLPSVVDLSQSFGVGRSTIREALSALKAMGWLDIRHGGGTFVSKTLPAAEQHGAGSLFREAESLREILEVRKVLEAGTAELAASRRTEEDLVKLEAILDRMERAALHNDTAESERADVDFHTAIGAASHNSLLNELMSSLTQRLTETIGRTRELWFYREQSTSIRLLDEHRAIYDAIAASDAELSVQRLQEHLSKVDAVLKRHGG